MNQNIQKEDSNKLLKLLGVGFGIAVTVGGTIGTGILRKPGPIAANLGDPSLIMLVWVLVSLYAFLGVLCTIELGVSVPRAGAWYVYARQSFWRLCWFRNWHHKLARNCGGIGFWSIYHERIYCL